ncbi:DUF1378 family protein [Pantoea sp. At-9b]|uniref:DUF1378 family protein n=1 Tax=Pantoea sp. (strain At-9b) TaxID=592316 RepID=UPI0001B3F4EB|nr:DUF1378 family protein [Pantoea sp. At-9b]ADU69448.1 protein of unknown function DUF1378 [Pantoea sp. At-9b]
MTFYETIMLWFSTIVSALYLIAGGWVKIRDYFKAKSQAKADAIEAEVQTRLKAAQAGSNDAPTATATSVAGSVNELKTTA